MLSRSPVYKKPVMKTSARNLFLPVCAAALIALCGAAPSRAEDTAAAAGPDTGVFPPQAAAEETPEYDLTDPGVDTHPVMRLTPEKSEIINLDHDVKSLIIGNPMHLNVVMDTTRRLVLVPRSPGATSFTALDDKGKVIMQRHVIVNGPNEKYVRIRRSCNAARTAGKSASGCEDMSMYYCPEGLCYPVEMVTSQKSVSASGNKVVAPAGSGGGSSGGLNRADTGSNAESYGDTPAVNPFELLMKALENGGQGSAPPSDE